MDVTAAATNDTTGPPDAVLKSITGYDPVSMACWARGAPTPYLHIARALAAMDSTTKRLRIGDALTNMFRSVIELCPGASTGMISILLPLERLELLTCLHHLVHLMHYLVPVFQSLWPFDVCGCQG